MPLVILRTLLVSLGTWIVERIGQYLISLGVAGVVYVGVDVMLDKAVGLIKQNISQVSGAFEVLMMAGFGEFLNIVFAAIAFVLTQRATSKFTASMGDGES